MLLPGIWAGLCMTHVGSDIVTCKSRLEKMIKPCLALDVLGVLSFIEEVGLSSSLCV